jgi:hypothetical protein
VRHDIGSTTRGVTMGVAGGGRKRLAQVFAAAATHPRSRRPLLADLALTDLQIVLASESVTRDVGPRTGTQ